MEEERARNSSSEKNKVKISSKGRVGPGRMEGWGRIPSHRW